MKKYTCSRFCTKTFVNFYMEQRPLFQVQFLRRVVALQLFMTMTATCSKFCTKTFVNFYVEQRPLFQVQFLRMCDGSSALIKVGQALQPTRAVSMYRYVPYHSCSLFSVLLLLRMEDGGTIHNTYFRLREVNFKLSQLL